MYPYMNRIKNYAVVSVPSTALGTNLFTSAQVAAMGSQARSLTISTDQDIALVDGTAAGTYAASPWKIAAGAVASFPYNGGPIKAIASSTTASVAVGVGLVQ